MLRLGLTAMVTVALGPVHNLMGWRTAALANRQQPA
jgi:hypothetical protein